LSLPAKRRPASFWEPGLGLCIALVMTVGLWLLADAGPLLRLEHLALDVRFRARTTPPKPAPLVIVGIDDASIAEIGRWPWSRAVLARFLDLMTADRAKVVAFDLLFREPQGSAAGAAGRATLEEELEAALPKLDPADQAKVKAVLGTLAQHGGADRKLAEAIARHGQVIVPFAIALDDSGAGPKEVPALPQALEKVEYPRVRGSAPDRLPEAVGLTLPIDPLLQAGLLAHVTTLPDVSGAYHYDYPVLRYDDSYLPSLSLEAVRSFLGVTRQNVIVDLGKGIDIGPLHVPTDDGMRLLINYYPLGSFKEVGFADVLAGRVPADVFAGKIVLVGATATGLGDFLTTPYTPALPGIERHATLIANMLDADFLRRDDQAVALDTLLIVLGGLVVGLAARWGALAAAATTALSLVGIASLDGYAFSAGLWLNFTFPAANLLVAFLAILAAKYVVETRRERWIREAFSRYLHPDVVDELCRSHATLRLGGEERELTVLFVDIRGFGQLAQALTAAELVTLLNEFFAAMTDVVLAHRGMLDKFIGDSLMAVFGAPLREPHHAVHACRAALEMRTALGVLHERWRAQNRPCPAMRIGINTGRMIIGNMGTKLRFAYTVIGDEVNLASRLERANKTLGTDILVSSATAAAAGDAIEAVSCGAIAIKGRHEKVEVFRLLPDAAAAEDTSAESSKGAELE
jgi:adenylate cyclase